MHRRKLDAYFVYLLNGGGESLAFALVFTVNMVYQARTVGLSPFELVLIGTVLEVTAFLSEIPTGIVADVYSRRLSVIIGRFLIGISFIMQGLSGTFAGIAISQVVLGIGWTFTSGATDAWITDEIGEENAGQAFIRISQVGRIAAMVGIVLSVLVASVRIEYAIIAGGVLHIALGLILVIVMPEDGFTPRPRAERETFGAMLRTVKDGTAMIKRRPVLITILLIAIVWGAASESFDRLYTPHLLDNFTLPAIGQFGEIVWFGVLSMVSMIIGIFIAEVVRKRVDTNKQTSLIRLLIGINLVLIVSIVTFAQAGALWLALLAFWTAGAVRGLHYPLQAAWINKGLDPKVRATMLSMASQADAVGQIAGGPAIGYIGNLSGLRTAISIGALLLTPGLLLYNRTLRKDAEVAVAQPVA